MATAEEQAAANAAAKVAEEAAAKAASDAAAKAAEDEAARLAAEAAAGGKDDGAPAKTEAELQAEAAAAAGDAAEKARNQRFADETKKTRKAEEAAAAAQRRLDLALEALAQATGKPAAEAKKAAEVEDPAPVPPVFENPEQYQKAMAEYTDKLVARGIRIAVKTSKAEEEVTRTKQTQQAQEETLRTAFANRRAAAIADPEMPDYLEVAENPDLTISIPMADAIRRSAVGPKVAYYLGKNQAEAARIHALHPAEQLLEMGVLVAKVSAPKTPVTTKAPAPIRTINGGPTPAGKAVGEMSMEEYAAHRAKPAAGVTH